MGWGAEGSLSLLPGSLSPSRSTLGALGSLGSPLSARSIGALGDSFSCCPALPPYVRRGPCQEKRGAVPSVPVFSRQEQFRSVSL